MEVVYDFKPPAGVEGFYSKWGPGKKDGGKCVTWWRVPRNSVPIHSDAGRDFEFIQEVVGVLTPGPSGAYDIRPDYMSRLLRVFKAGILAWTMGSGDAGPHNMLCGRLVDCFDARGDKFYHTAACFFDLLHSRGQYAARDYMGPLEFAAKALLPEILKWAKYLKSRLKHRPQNQVINLDAAITILESGKILPDPKAGSKSKSKSKKRKASS